MVIYVLCIFFGKALKILENANDVPVVALFYSLLVLLAEVRPKLKRVGNSSLKIFHRVLVVWWFIHASGTEEERLRVLSLL